MGFNSGFKGLNMIWEYLAFSRFRWEVNAATPGACAGGCDSLLAGE